MSDMEDEKYKSYKKAYLDAKREWDRVKRS